MRLATVKKLHFGVLFFLLFNLALQAIFNIGFNAWLVFGLKVVAYLAGIALFISLWKKRTLLKYFAGLYVFAPLAVIVGYLLNSILGTILGSIFLVFLYPPDPVFKQGPYEVRASFAGFMGRCCSFSLYENKYLLFEKWRADFEALNQSQTFTKLEWKDRNQAIFYFNPENETPDTALVNINN
jgi:hypothetical protein